MCIYGVLRTSLLDILLGRVANDAKAGKNTALTPAEEQVLCRYINLMADIGYPLQYKQLLQEVKIVMDKDGWQMPFTDNLPGRAWFQGFSQRNPGNSL